MVYDLITMSLSTYYLLEGVPSFSRQVLLFGTVLLAHSFSIQHLGVHKIVGGFHTLTMQ